MLLLIDGYNVTMRDPELSGLSKEGQRETLIARLNAAAPELAMRGTIVVVFDARAELGVSGEESGSVRAVYAPDADTEIVRRCEAAREHVVVVTDDMRLRARIAQDVTRRIDFRATGELFSAKARKGSARRGSSGAGDEGLPPGAKDITAELEKLWVDEGED